MPANRCGCPSSFFTGMENCVPTDRSSGAGKAQVAPPPSSRRTVRAPTPPRGGPAEEQRQVLWMVFSAGRCVRTDIVALTDAVELEIFAGTELRRVLRFLRDTGARNYAARLHSKLAGRGFRERRQNERGYWLK